MWYQLQRIGPILFLIFLNLGCASYAPYHIYDKRIGGLGLTFKNLTRDGLIHKLGSPEASYIGSDGRRVDVFFLSEEYSQYDRMTNVSDMKIGYEVTRALGFGLLLDPSGATSYIEKMTKELCAMVAMYDKNGNIENFQITRSKADHERVKKYSQCIRSQKYDAVRIERTCSLKETALETLFSNKRVDRTGYRGDR